MIEVLERLFTVAEYLEKEEKSEQKHYFEKGEIIPMAGSTPIHNLIATNLTTIFNNQLAEREQRYFVLNSDTKLAIESIDIIRYPDALVICDKIEYYQDRKDVIVNPILIAEVLSKSTENEDRGSKFEQYKFIPTLKEYLLVDQYQPYATSYLKVAENTWRTHTVMSLEDTLSLDAIDCKLHLKQVYRNVDFKAR